MSPAAPFLIKLTMDDYRIWVTYHKDELVERYGLKNDDTHSLFATHKEIDGENINALNPVYSEMVTMWYVWKNNVKTKYVGFNHYRRKFGVNRLPVKGECQVLRVIDFGSKTVYQQYEQYHNKRDMDVVIGLLDEAYGKDNPYTKHIMESRRLIGKCCFFMQWNDFTKLCKFLFGILDGFSEKCGCKTLDDWQKKAAADFGGRDTEYQTRAVSFLAERLISAWISTNMKYYVGNRNVAIVNYNTKKLTEAAIKSLMKFTPGCSVFVFDNSDKGAFKTSLPNVKVIDNTKGQLIDFDKELEKYPDKWERDVKKSNYGSMKHTMSVDMLMDMIPDGFVLMDSDVLLKKDISPLWDERCACIGSEEVKHNVPLLMPFACYLNVPMLRDKGIHYYNGEKMWALNSREHDQYYDTGAWLLEEVRRNGLPVRYVNIWDFVIHLGHGSWRGQNSDKWLEENKVLFT